DRRERRRLPGAGRTRHEHHAVMVLGEPADAGRELELLEARNVARDDAEGEGDVAALPEGVDAEARQARMLVGRVELAVLEERGEAHRIGAADLADDVLELRRLQQVPALERSQVSVATQDRRLAHL